MKKKILDFLKKNAGYVSGEEISRQLRISRSAIWKYVRELRVEGYDIEAVPHLGYRLLNLPDKLFPLEIQDKLKTKEFGRQIVYFDSIGSTMDEAFRLAMNGAKQGAIVCAEHQSKGKGRQGRHWSSPRGKGIYMSIILRPRMAPSNVPQLTLLSAVAVSEAVESLTDVECRIKWPNDVLVKGKKLAGILTEMSAETDRTRFIVIGVGINVNTPLNSLPINSTSIKHECGDKCSRAHLIKGLLECLEKRYYGFQKNGFVSIAKKWKERSVTIGKRIKVIDVNGSVEGKAVGIDDYGALVIRNDDGAQIKRMSGDVVHIN